MPDMNEKSETQQEYLGKVKSISAEGLQSENTNSYKMGEIIEMDADFVTLLNFIDWYSPTREVNEKLTKMLRHIGSQTYQNQTKIEEAKELLAKLLEEEKDNMYWEMNGSDKSSYYEVRKQAEQFLKGQKNGKNSTL